MNMVKRYVGRSTASIAPKSEHGAVIILVAVALVVLLAMASLAIDSAFLMTVHSDLRRTADAAVLASTAGLLVGQAEARQRGQQFAQLNPVLGTPVSLVGQQVQFGVWDPANDVLLTSAAPNATRVRIQLDDSSTPPGPLSFFGTLAAPGRTTVTATSTAALGTRSIVLALDRSGSMSDDGSNPQQPMTATKQAAQDFLSLLQNFPVVGDKIGLVSYNQESTLNQPLSDNFSQTATAIGNGTSGLVANGCTNIAAALCRARLEVLSPRAGNRGARVVILLSDGRTNSRRDPTTCAMVNAPCIDTGSEFSTGSVSDQQARQEAQRLADQGVTLFTISLGTRTNPAAMTQMAQITGGRHYIAPTAADLDAVFQQIAAQIPIALVE